MHDATNFRVGVIRSDVTHKHLAANGFEHLVLVRDPARNLDMLKRGRIDHFPYSRPVIGIFTQKNQFNPDELLGMVRLDEISTGLYMVFSKSTKQEIVQRAKESFARILASGRYDEIISPVISMMAEYDIDTLR